MRPVSGDFGWSIHLGGSQAIFRFARPVCYQGFPDDALPEELKDANPMGIWRMVDGQMTRESNAQALVSRTG